MDITIRQPSSLPLNRAEILTQLRKEAPIIKERYGIINIGLFGSYARDEADPMSDIDLLVSFEEGKEKFRTYMQCIFYLEQIFGKKVELISEHSLDHRIRSSVEREVIWV